MQAALRIGLPAESTVQYAEFDAGFPDGCGVLQIRFPRSELRTFLDNSPFRNKEMSSSKRSISDYDAPSDSRCWFPDKVVRFHSAEVSNSREVHRILIDLDDSDVCTVYLMWFEL